MPCRVFIADDVDGIRNLWRLFLDEDGAFAVAGEAGDGQAVLEGIAATRPDVVVLDLSMPGMDGLEVLEALRHSDPHLPVVVASGLTGSRLRDRTLHLGASGFFEKGRPATELVEMVRTAWRQSADRSLA
jgi:DNA-binding NarL/FixJ family response regulator